MAENMGTPPFQEPQKNNRTLMIVIIVLVVLLCCCCVGSLVALYYGYDYLGDPLGIYGLLPVFGQAI